MISCYVGCQFFFGFEGLTATFVFFFGHGIHTKENDVCHTDKLFEHAARGEITEIVSYGALETFL